MGHLSDKHPLLFHKVMPPSEYRCTIYKHHLCSYERNKTPSGIEMRCLYIIVIIILSLYHS